MIDYNELKDLPDAEINALCQNIANERNKLAKKYNSMAKKEKRKNENIVQQCN